MSYDKQIKKLTRELKIKTELRAESVKEINRLQDKINVGMLILSLIQ